MAIEGDCKEAVRRALEELERAHPGRVTAKGDGEGGAIVLIEDIELGSPYEQASTWVGFHVGFQYPIADVYPHHVRGDLKRADGRAVGEGMSVSTFEGRPSIQISRRSNHLDPSVQTAFLKLEKVLSWLKSRL